MKYGQKLVPAVLIRRYQRFLADVRLADGSELTVHCPNSGSMLGCREPGSEVMLSRSGNIGRKYPHTLELVKTAGGWVGVNTGLTNRIVREGIEREKITDFGTISHIQPEVKINEKSRLDFLLYQGSARIYLEVKSCTLVQGNIACFPDAVTSRGTRHLLDLAALRDTGCQAAVLFCIQREDAELFSPAAAIDPVYAATLKRVQDEGVMVLAYQAKVSPAGIEIFRSIPVAFHDPVPRIIGQSPCVG